MFKRNAAHLKALQDETLRNEIAARLRLSKTYNVSNNYQNNNNGNGEENNTTAAHQHDDSGRMMMDCDNYDNHCDFYEENDIRSSSSNGIIVDQNIDADEVPTIDYNNLPNDSVSDNVGFAIDENFGGETATGGDPEDHNNNENNEVDIRNCLWEFDRLHLNETLQYFLRIYGDKSICGNYPDDHASTILPNTVINEIKEFMNIRTFSEGLIPIQSAGGVKDNAMLRILTYLSKAIPGIRLPISESKNGNVTLTLGSYAYIDYRKFKVNVCPAGCVAYIGRYKNCFRCPNKNCRIMRYEPCRYKSHGHDFSGRENCDPYRNESNSHSYKFRTPRKAYYYRALIPLLQHTIEWSLGQGNSFLNIFEKTRTEARIESQSVGDGISDIKDILDAEQCRKHSSEMHERYIKNLEQYPVSLEYSLLLSQFYDGGGLFDRNHSSIWPLVISILNCNPSARIAHGVGLFLVALHDLKLGTPAEQSIYTELFIPELQQLGTGINFNIVLPDKTKRRIFLQARLVLHQLDTKALECVACVKGTVLNLYNNISGYCIYILLPQQGPTRAAVANFVT